MTTSLDERSEVDRVLLGWVFVWSFALSFAVAEILGGSNSEELSDETQSVFGVAIGGLSAAWTLIGTWIALIHLPQSSHAPNTCEHSRQRMGPRIQVMLVWLANALILSFALRQESKVLTQIFLTSAIGIFGPLIVWQWTRQRICRGVVRVGKKRSIRQILGLTSTVALAIALLKFSDRWLGVSSSLIAMVLSSAMLWIIMLSMILGRWWGLIVITIPAVIVQWIIVSTFLDVQDRNAETQIIRFSGTILGFYFFSMLFLLLMRSSGHRWLVSDVSAKVKRLSSFEQRQIA